MDIPRLGKQPPRYTFFLNPYADVRFTKCPKCSSKAKQTKLPLVIHVDEGGIIAVNRTCRYCPGCDLLIAHQDEIEANLAALFEMRAPEVIGNDYLVVGTLDRPDWKRGITGTMTIGETIEALHDFEDVVRFEPPPGWIRTGRNGKHPG
jgi:hypothetical protein